jgi:hypothetical protein
MKMRLASLLAVALAAAAPAVLAQQQPILSVSMTEIDVAGGFTYGENPIYSTGGVLPLNGGNGPYTDQVTMWALATGTSPESGFTYTFYVNGNVIGNATTTVPTVVSPATPPPSYPYPQAVSWTPPQPGTYYFSVVATDGSHTATSLAVEYFATGITIVSPVQNAILPLGSSVVIQAAAAVPSGAVSHVAFYADGVLLGTANNYPYSIIYTPDPTLPAGTVHFIKAVSYLADGVTVASTSPLQGIVSVAAVQPLPACSIGSPAQTYPPTTVPIPDYNAGADAYVPVTVNASSSGTIEKVELYINGVLYGTQTALPYNFEWTPSVAGTYYLTALAYDAKNNVIASTTSTAASLTPAPTTVVIGSLPSCVITSPTNGSQISGGSTSAITASATDNNVYSAGSLNPKDASGNPLPDGTPVPIHQVQFYQDGSIVGTALGVVGVSVYTISFTPVQKVNASTGAAEDSVLTAVATDALGFQGVSPTVSVSVTAGGSSGSVITGVPPTVSLTSPANSANVYVNTNVTLSASAIAPNGNVASVSFLVDSVVLETASKYPYSVVWTPTNLGFYTITAQVIDNDGDKSNSTPVTVYVVAPPAPTVSVTSPSPGGILTVGSPVTITASAASPTGTIAQVQFYENGVSIGTVTSSPYSISFTPTSTGLYTLTAVTTDNSGLVTNSNSVVVEAAPSTGGVNTSVYFGNYVGVSSTDEGIFAFVVSDGVSGTYISFPTLGTSRTATFIPDITISSEGSFTTTSIYGTAAAQGVSGSLLPGNEDFIGGVSIPATWAVASGYYMGDIAGQANTEVAAIVGVDGRIMVYVANGSFTDAGFGDVGTVGSDGSFTIGTAGNNTITGTVDPTRALINATMSGSAGGTILAGKVSGGVFSDGTLRNISTRGDVGAGADEMIAGFVVGGTASKNLLIRAIGPGLTAFGVSGALATTQLSIYQGSSLIATNTGWSSTTANAYAVASAEISSGAFALGNGSGDSAIVASFAPGAYTATVNGTGGNTGIALVEAYDLDTYMPFTANKLINVSTRGNVGPGGDVLIGGLIINGSTPKKLLIRGAGPSLGPLGVANFLATPRLQLFDSTATVIRENFEWQTGNDPGLISAAEKATGAFPFASGSADSAILIVLNPGAYTVQVSGPGSATGIALVEVYEVP